MSKSPWPRRIAAFVAAVLLGVIWGSVLQTQYNLAALESIGAAISGTVRWRTTLQDLLGFGPLYAVVVTTGLAFAFALAALPLRRWPGLRFPLFALAGFIGLIVAIRSVDALVPPPVLIAATRTTAGLLWMALGGAIGGVVFVALAPMPRTARG